MSKRFGRSQKRKMLALLEEQHYLHENRLYIEFKRRSQVEASLQRSLFDFATMKAHLEEKFSNLTCGKNTSVERVSQDPEQPSLRVTEIQLAGSRFRVRGEIANIDAMRYAKEFAEQVERQIYQQLLPLVVADRKVLHEKGMLPKFEM